MERGARVIGAAGIVLAPLLAGVADEIRMLAEPPQSGTLIDSEYGVGSVLASLDVIEQNRGLFVLAGALSYAAVPLFVVALLAIWHLSVGRAPRWAWAGAIVAGLGALGLTVHFVGYYGQTLTALGLTDRTAAAEFVVAAERTGLMIAFFLPFFLVLISPIVQGVGLWRAGVIRLWALLAITAGAVLTAVVGSTPWSTAAAAVLFIGGYTPAARAMLRSVGDGRRSADERGMIAAPA